MVAGPHRSGKSSFIQTFINYNFDFQKVKYKGNRSISKARKIINNVEFEIEFLESQGFDEDQNWADIIEEEIKLRFHLTANAKRKRKEENFGFWNQGKQDRNVR